MDSDLLILPECYIDTTLAEVLAFPKKGYTHIKGCNSVLKKMNEELANRAALGIIDDDKCVPALFNSFTLLKKHNENLSIYKHSEKPHYIVKISKAVEDFILKNAEKCGISLTDYNLPADLPNLIKRTKHITIKKDPDLKRLFSAIKKNENSDFFKLAQWIESFKENPYNFNISNIKNDMETKQKTNKYPLELATMPGFAGSSAYYLRYEDPQNNEALVSKEANEYWRNVDLYIGGTEHATGHLIYSRFWNKFLYDYGYIVEDEPFKKLINQGMIQGRTSIVYRHNPTQFFFSKDVWDDITGCYSEERGIMRESEFKKMLKGFGIDINNSNNIERNFSEIRIPIKYVENDILDIDSLKKGTELDYLKNADFIGISFDKQSYVKNGGIFKCGYLIEKMSKTYYNVVNPDDVVEKFGADTLRLYEMFLGPIEQSKPWDTNGIDGVSRFLRKFWNLFFQGDTFTVSDEQPTAEELKSIHKLIKKIGQDIENFSFNTSVAAFMICANELTALKCNKQAVLQDFVIVLSPFAPHIAEELWHRLGNDSTVCDAKFPEYKEEYLKENSVKYTVSFNGKVRFTMDFPVDTAREEVEKTVLANESSQKWMEGKTPKKVIVVLNKVVNIVI